MKLSTLSYTQGEIADANINRSPTSYLANPEEERNQYPHDTDHTMVQLNIFEAEGGKPRGEPGWICLFFQRFNPKLSLVFTNFSSVLTLKNGALWLPM